MDKQAVKAREAASWTRVAPGWRKHDDSLAEAFGVVTDRLLAAAGIGPGARVLDVATGTGEPALSAAARVGAAGRVLATDLVEEMLRTAREKAAARQLTNVEFRQQDGEQLAVPPEAFDAVTIRWGLMFMPEPAACLRGAFTALGAGGRIALACWAAPERNPWASMPASVLRRRAGVEPPPPGTPGMFAFADPGRLRGALEQAGFRDVTVEEMPLVTPTFLDGSGYFQWTAELAGPIAGLLAQLPQPEQEAAAREIAGEAERRSEVAGVVRLPALTWVASGVK